MTTTNSITEFFGENLAEILADKILIVHNIFNKEVFVETIKTKKVDKTYTQRVELIADELKRFLTGDYKKDIKILIQILGPENENETGMFKNFYWLMPVGKFVEKYGIEDFKISIQAIEEITKRNTGEYAIRPYIRKYPNECLIVLQSWAKSSNFHLRRLACEGSRPKLPWAPKLETFINNPQPIFDILEILKEDEIKFVKKSVANHIRDYLKVNPSEIQKLIKRWSKSNNPNTIWILKHAQRK
jgi:3-methyladenine DNA glycosylase AlkC